MLCTVHDVMYDMHVTHVVLQVSLSLSLYIYIYIHLAIHRYHVCTVDRTCEYSIGILYRRLFSCV